MKRAPELRPLSHDHRLALFVAQRLRRCTPATLDDALARLRAFWSDLGQRHFAAEERWFTPELCAGVEGWAERVKRMRDEHDEIRRRADTVTGVVNAHALGALLHDHVRFEERELFPIVEATLYA